MGQMGDLSLHLNAMEVQKSVDSHGGQWRYGTKTKMAGLGLKPDKIKHITNTALNNGKEKIVSSGKSKLYGGTQTSPVFFFLARLWHPSPSPVMPLGSKSPALLGSGSLLPSSVIPAFGVWNSGTTGLWLFYTQLSVAFGVWISITQI